MREAIGGAWLTGIVVLFIVLFSAFLAISVNYTKAFRAKNKIINLIEENEGFSITRYSSLDSIDLATLRQSNRTEDKVYAYLKDAGSATAVKKNGTYVFKCPDGSNPREGGYCVKKVASSQGSYYKVTTFIKIELPLISNTFTVPISGDTKVLYFTND